MRTTVEITVQTIASIDEDKAIDKYKMKSDDIEKRGVDALGTGKTSHVYKCFLKNQPNKPAAIKYYKNYRDHFDNELKIMKILTDGNAPYIVHLHGYYIGSQDSIVMEYADSSLTQVFKTFDEKKQIKTLLELTCAVSELHGTYKIVHRDIKIDNVLMVNDVTKVCDFGVSRLETELQPNRAGGTPFYMAPEVLLIFATQYDEEMLKIYPRENNDDIHSYAADIFSLGIVMWEIMSKTIAPDYYENIMNDLDIKQFCKFIIDEKMRPEIEVFSGEHRQIYNQIEKAWAHDRLFRPSAKKIFNSLNGLGGCTISAPNPR